MQQQRQMTWIDGELYYRESPEKKWRHHSRHEHASRFQTVEHPEIANLFTGGPLHSPGWPLFQFLLSHNWQLVKAGESDRVSKKRK